MLRKFSKEGGDFVSETCKMLLTDWNDHAANVGELMDTAISFAEKQCVMSALLSQLKSEIETSHELWLRLQTFGFTSQEDAATAAYKIMLKEA